MHKINLCNFYSRVTSGFISQQGADSSFTKADSWVILSPIEQRIKSKIEQLGTPLKDWDINIFRGILTGYNEAFIIDGKKRDELIAADPKSAEIIRPILRGRDIRRYSYDYADLWIIATFPSLKIDIDQYFAVKEHLMSFSYDRLKQTGAIGARKKTNNKWFETQDSISYWDDFDRQKIIYPEITKFLNFYCDSNNFYVNNKCFILTGKHIFYLTAFLNSSLFKYCFKDNFPELLGGTRELRKIFLEKVSVLEVSNEINAAFEKIVSDLQDKQARKLNTQEIEIKIDEMLFDLYDLNTEERIVIDFITIT